jgi:hypothetical protein
MADIKIRLTKSELLEQMKVRDFWSEVAFQEGYEVARGYTFDDLEEEEIVEVQAPQEVPSHWSVADVGLGLSSSNLIELPPQGQEWRRVAAYAGKRQAA